MAKPLHRHSRWTLVALLSCPFHPLFGCSDKPDAVEEPPITGPTDTEIDKNTDSPTETPRSQVRIAKIEESSADAIEVYLSKDDEFYVGASRPALRIGSQLFVLSRHPSNGDLKTLIFRIPKNAFFDIEDNEPIYFAAREADLAAATKHEPRREAIQGRETRETWFLGNLNKSKLETTLDREGGKQ